jgi:hypothetical protein
MRFGAYVFLMLSISIAFLLLGQGGALFYILGVGSQGPTATTYTIAGMTIDQPAYGGIPINILSIATRFVQVIATPQNLLIMLGL